jgi:ComF family protein
MRSLARFIDAVLPPRCPFTGEVVDSQGTVSPKAWAALSFITAPYCHACGFPFEFTVPAGSTEALCAGCLAKRPDYSKARAALVYNDASRDFILGFKHGDRIHSVVPMIPWLKQAGADVLPDTDIIIPVPLHRWRLLRRRYNQAAIIGQALAKETGKTFIADGLIRTRATPTQGHLKAKERAQNVKKAFSLHPRRNVAGKKILLIDDVYTTGATVRECVKILIKAGATEVNILTLARVVRDKKI